jgi:alpha-mannosidase
VIWVLPLAAGYFTSRATSKGWIREATAYLQAARQLEVLTQPQFSAKHPNTDSLEEAVSLLQHHDAITGTEKQHVTDDYHVRLARGKQLFFVLVAAICT